MRKIIPYILIAVIALTNIFAPFSVGWEDKTNSPVVEKNYAEAEDGGIKLEVIPSRTDHTITIKTTPFWATTDGTSEGVRITIEDLKINEVVAQKTFKINNGQEENIPFNDLNSSNPYKVTVEARQIGRVTYDSIVDLLKLNVGLNFMPLWNDKFYEKGKEFGSLFEVKQEFIITTSEEGETDPVTGPKVVDTNKNWGDLPSCKADFWNTIPGCFGQAIYYIIFVPTSYLFALAGTFFDNTFAYSVNDESYRSAFVVQGWKIVRDFCNMFFIFILLYIAFGTILNLSSFDTKKMIINVVIIGLLINFSLFAARVIIDTSNILARVFYNSEIYKDKDGNPITKDTEIIPLSEVLVHKVNPQTLIMNAEKVDDLEEKGNVNAAQDNNSEDSINTGTFILVTLLATGINIVGFIVFLSVGLIFVTRVIGLWLAMILAPLAFFSYAVPAMQNLEMVGWKRWWADLLKLAFLAPVFIFFLYLILQFLNTGLDIINADGKTGLNFVISIIIPFAFIMVLLMKAKDIAKSMSGKIGQAALNTASKVGKTAGMLAGGAVVGVAAGGAAIAGRATAGRLGSVIANSNSLKTDEARGGLTGFASKQMRNFGKFMGQSSFDARGAKIGGKSLADTGLKVGKSKAGGFEKMKADSILAKQKRAKELEVGGSEPLMKTLNETENDLQGLLGTYENTLKDIDVNIEKSRQNLKDARNRGDEDATVIHGSQLEAYKKQKKAIRKGENMATQGVEYFDDNMNIIQINEDYSAATTGTTDGGDRKTMDYLEYTSIQNAKRAIEGEDRRRKRDYANSISSKTSKVFNNIFSGGQYSAAGANEVAAKIRSGAKIEDKNN